MLLGRCYVFWRLLSFVCLVVLLSSASSFSNDDEIDQRPVPMNSKFNWIVPRTDYVMPWTRGPNVCAVEEVVGPSKKRYHSECMAFLPRRICEKPTFIRYHCCTGYEKELKENSTGCQGVKPIDDLMNTISHLFLRDFRKQLKTSGCDALFVDTSATYTVFAPQNKAFDNLTQATKDMLSVQYPWEDNLLLHHVVKDRFYLADLRNAIEIQTLYRRNETLVVHRYSNGIVTVNCVRIILPNQPATNGLIHVTEQVIRPINVNRTIFDVLDADDRFSEFVSALEKTRISDELKSVKHHTVFAATDAAFRSLDLKSAERIFHSDDSALLKKLLYYHIIDCHICSAAILGPTSVRTLEGQKVNLSCDIRDRLVVNEIVCSEVDLLASNGVIHVIDKLLIPDSVKSVVEMLVMLDLRTFMDYVRQSGMEELIDGSRGKEHVTLFVPTDEAFRNMTDSEKTRLKSGKWEMKRIVDYHVIPGKVTTKQMIGTDVVRTGTEEGGKGNGIFLNVNVEDYTVNNARITSMDHVVANGVVHVIDRVLLPPEGDIVDKIKENSQFSTLVNLLQLSGLDVTLTKDDRRSSWTLFAPTNAAFDRMDDRLLARLVDNRLELIEFLRYHVIERATYSCGIRSRLEYRFRTAAGEWIRAKRKRNTEPIVLNERVKVTQSDLQTVNGVIHVVDQVLLCPCLDRYKTNREA